MRTRFPLFDFTPPHFSSTPAPTFSPFLPLLFVQTNAFENDRERRASWTFVSLHPHVICSCCCIISFFFICTLWLERSYITDILAPPGCTPPPLDKFFPNQISCFYQHFARRLIPLSHAAMSLSFPLREHLGDNRLARRRDRNRVVVLAQLVQ